MQQFKEWFVIPIKSISVTSLGVALWVFLLICSGYLIGEIGDYFLGGIILMVILSTYGIVGLILYHTVLKNTSFRMRKANYWFLIGFYMFHTKSRSRYNEFMLSLRME